MLKTTGRLISSALLALVCGGMVLAARTYPQWLYLWYPALSQSIMARVGAVTGLLPVSLAELVIVILVLWLILTLIRVLQGKSSIARWLSGVLLGAMIGVTWFVAVWGLNYFSPYTLADRMGLEVTGYTTDQLYNATAYYLAQANDLAGAVPRDEDGVAALGTFSELADWSGEGYEILAEDYACFCPSMAMPKRVLLSRLLSYSGITGIFICFTGEANVNDETPQAALPFTMAHERGHAQAICPEEECNFAAYLACMANPHAECRYSGAYSAFIYCYNALYKQSSTRAAELWYQMNDQLKTDILYANAHYERFEGKVQETAEKVNDTYLKTFQQTAGVQSYGLVADLLIAWYLQAG